MCDCCKKMSYKRFRVLDIGRDIRCKKCSRVVEMADWMRWTLFLCLVIIMSFEVGAYTWLESRFGWDKIWRALHILPMSIMIMYVFMRPLGYWMYSIAYRVNEKHKNA